MANAGQHTGDEDGRQTCREDEPGCIAADDVDDVTPRGDIAAHDAERLAQRPFDDRDAVRHIVTLGDPAAARAVHADRMDFVAIGQRIICVGEVTNVANVSHIAVHRIDALEGNQLGRLGVFGGQQRFEMGEVIVAPDTLLAATVADAGDHARVVELVGEDDAAGQDFAQCCQSCLIRNIAAGEQQCAILAVKVSQLLF